MTSVIGLHCPRQHSLNHKQLVHARLRLVEAAIKFGNQEVNQLKVDKKAFEYTHRLNDKLIK